ncbi:hypothetical protein CEN49_20125 [Fischerella thermalis CCMEE 5273]|uniref:Amidohydrolase n=1 Tax=Chlorogloeopsis fritschii PCC 6912 TaxID=211165 RepID=A0A433NL67_CHLFR|nr:amidohydrolase family protein [Chlorogloeopsis fritschii]PMB04715.1 hypothetical protein CEN49_20125 [Fischerella thermalis CCMEE 5273]PMB49130.1 hypothetical protein CEN40_05730 [Fischerella thermalis CCMEE 5205]RUR83653.1 amidohydrolase [Chlorogloeopsis fritschii PCC 6912]
MIENNFVIDAAVHAFDFSNENRVRSYPPDKFQDVQNFWHQVIHASLESLEPGYLLGFEEFTKRWQAEDLAHALFVESDLDMVVAHSVQISAVLQNGPSPWDTHVELKRLAPDRVLLYAEVDTFAEDKNALFDHMEKRVSQGAVGFKFYPSNGMFDIKSNKMVSMFYDDPENAYKLFEKARELGVKHVAFHKAQPVGPGPSDVVNVQDISTAAAVFPDMTFEVVHTGWAFLEDSALQMQMHPNVYANLESTMGLVVRQPRRFAHIIGKLLQYGKPEQLLFSSGCVLNHPDPIIKAFIAFEMPEDLREGYEYPELTLEIKRKILGENMARIHGIDIEQIKNRIKNDRWSRLKAKGKAEPWSSHRARIGSVNKIASRR